jgi:hypothetical protein
VTRGGSFLCNEDYCVSYRPGARRGTDPYNNMSHLGFRLVMDKDAWEGSNKRHQVARADARSQPRTRSARRQRQFSFTVGRTRSRSHWLAAYITARLMPVRPTMCLR